MVPAQVSTNPLEDGRPSIIIDNREENSVIEGPGVPVGLGQSDELIVSFPR